MVQRFEPSQGYEGFFIARFLKVAAEAQEDPQPPQPHCDGVDAAT